MSTNKEIDESDKKKRPSPKPKPSAPPKPKIDPLLIGSEHKRDTTQESDRRKSGKEKREK